MPKLRDVTLKEVARMHKDVLKNLDKRLTELHEKGSADAYNLEARLWQTRAKLLFSLSQCVGAMPPTKEMRERDEYDQDLEAELDRKYRLIFGEEPPEEEPPEDVRIVDPSITEKHNLESAIEKALDAKVAELNKEQEERISPEERDGNSKKRERNKASAPAPPFDPKPPVKAPKNGRKSREGNAARVVDERITTRPPTSPRPGQLIAQSEGANELAENPDAPAQLELGASPHPTSVGVEYICARCGERDDHPHIERGAEFPVCFSCGGLMKPLRGDGPKGIRTL